MDHLLLFPIERQDRGLDPGPFTTHQSYKPHLQKVFRGRCIYCLTPDSFKSYSSFGVDHYLPRSTHPYLSLTWSNLFYACNDCNSRKSDFVSTPLLFLPNPCDHQMADHLQYQGTLLETHTKHGSFLVDLLRLRERSPDREFVLYCIGLFLRRKLEVLRELASLEEQAELSVSQEEEEQNEAAIRAASHELEKLNSYIERVAGEAPRSSTLKPIIY